MKKVFLDTNFLMDLLIRDDEYRKTARTVLERSLDEDIEFHISFLSVANFAYIVRKESHDKLYHNIELICSLFTVVSNDESHLLKALQISTKDYEDAVQYETAVACGCEGIITRNEKDFRFSELPVFTPLEFLENLDKGKGSRR